jgi:hypothetical protein
MMPGKVAASSNRNSARVGGKLAERAKMRSAKQFDKKSRHSFAARGGTGFSESFSLERRIVAAAMSFAVLLGFSVLILSSLLRETHLDNANTNH